MQSDVSENPRPILHAPREHPYPEVQTLPTSSESTPDARDEWRVHDHHGVSSRQTGLGHIQWAQVSIKDPRIHSHNGRLTIAPLLR